MRILICTGIFPPLIGGPSQYAKQVFDEWKRQGHGVKVLTYRLEIHLPTGLRHIVFFLRTVANIFDSDFIFALDTFSVGLPAVLAAKIFRKKIIIRTGGDFLWESYVERTGDKVPLKEFYTRQINNFSFKEKTIFNLTKWALNNVNALIFSTEWQRDIFTPAYGLDSQKNFIVENHYGEKIPSFSYKTKNFIAGARQLKWKNLDFLKIAFKDAQKVKPEIELDLSTAPYDEFLNKIQHAYAVILVSLGDISPNMIMDSIKANKPFIVTREVGIYERIKDIAIFVDPLDKNDIKNKILLLSNDKNYMEYRQKIEKFNYRHSWKQICDEIIQIANQIK